MMVPGGYSGGGCCSIAIGWNWGIFNFQRNFYFFIVFQNLWVGAFIKTFYWPLIVCFTSGRPLQGNCLPHVDMPLTVSKFNEVTPWENEEKGAPKVPADKGRNGTSITLTMAPTSARQKKLWWWCFWLNGERQVDQFCEGFWIFTVLGRGLGVTHVVSGHLHAAFNC